MHSNGGTYGADDYLPGGTYQNDASQVNIVDGSNPSDFYYVVTDYYYNTLGGFTLLYCLFVYIRNLIMFTLIFVCS